MMLSFRVQDFSERIASDFEADDADKGMLFNICGLVYLAKLLRQLRQLDCYKMLSCHA